MTTWQWLTLAVLAALGAGGTCFRAWVAWQEHKAAERMRKWAER